VISSYGSFRSSPRGVYDLMTRSTPLGLRLCQTTRASGSLIPDAYLAALALEHGYEWISLITTSPAPPT
jgi:hypothetical protein